MSAPKGPASISTLMLPSPSVVVGDTMRDSTGAVAPLRVIAYDANDTPIVEPPTLFLVIDTSGAGHIANSNKLVGDKLGSISVLGQIAGIQTTTVGVPVTIAPITFVLPTGLPDTLVVPFAGDTTASSTGSTAIAVTLKGRGDTASVGFIVKYDLVNAPASIPGSTTGAVYIGNDAGQPSPRDTTDAGGASRKLFVKSWLLADAALKAGQRTDSAVVLVSTAYKGKQVNGSPIRVVIRIKVKLAVP
jgi:hypothetical protein